MVQKQKAFRFSRKLLAAVLALVMVLAATPVAFAADDDATETPAVQQGHVVSAEGTWCILPDNNNGQAAVYFSTNTDQNYDSALKGITNDLNYTYVQLADDDVVSISFGYGTKKLGNSYTAWTNAMKLNELAATTQWTVNSSDAGWGDDLENIVVPNGFTVNTENYKWIGTISFPAEGAGTYQATYYNEIQTKWAGMGKAETGSGTVTINITVLDKRELVKAIDTAEALLAQDGAYMTDASKQTLEDALVAAQALSGDVVAEQTAIDSAAQVLNGAIAAVAYNPANSTELAAAINAASDVYLANEEDNYTAETWAPFKAAYEAAAAIYGDIKNMDARNQAEIDEAAQTLSAAFAALDKIANYTIEELTNLVSEKEAFLAENKAYMTEDSAAAMQAAIDNAKSVIASGDATKIDAAYTELAGVEVSYTAANYDVLTSAVEDANAFLADADELQYYEESAIEELKAAVEAAAQVQSGQDSRYQPVIDAAAQAIKDAMPQDSDLKRADLSALNEAVAAGRAKLAEEGIDDYTVGTVNALDSAVLKAEKMQTNVPSIKEQDAVNAAAEAIYTAIDNLTLLRADYTALQQAIAQAETQYNELVASAQYTDESLQAYAAAIAAAKQVVADQPYSVREQAKVAAEVATLNAAAPDASDLKPADLSALNAAIEAAETAMAADDYNEYTEYTRQALESALAAARELANANPTILQQDDVAQAADAVTNAINALVKAEADYTALDAVIATAEVKLATNLSDTYTLTSIAALQDAVNNAKAIDRHLPSDQQATVDNAAQTIKDAINGLQTYTNVKDAVVDIVDENGNVVEGDVLYVKAEWWDALYTNVDTTIGVKSDALADDVTITWEYANWSVDDPEANITASADGMTANVKPNGKGVGARSCWVKVTLTDANGNTAERTVKVRFYKFDWQK